MMGEAHVFQPGSLQPEVTHFRGRVPPLEFLRDAVGGYIELVPFFDTYLDRAARAFCNENGTLGRVLINRPAASAFGQTGH